MQTKKTLYVSDMDGTLLDNDSRVSAVTSRLLSELSSRGALITVATARTPATVQPLLESTYTRCPAIVMTGAALWDRRLRRYEEARLVDTPTVAGVVDDFAACGVDPFVYALGADGALDVYHGAAMNVKERDFYEARRHLALKTFHLGMSLPQERSDRVILLFAIGPTDRIRPLADRLRARGDCSVSCYPDLNSPSVSLIEVFAPGVSKAAAVECLARHCSAGRIVVFGDNLNDIPMMEVADVAVAVENAFPEVKERADVVIGRNSADAVARFIAADFDNNGGFGTL